MRCIVGLAILAATIRSSVAIDCAPNFSSCQPTGAAKTALPPVGKDLGPLYQKLLSSIKGIHFKRDPRLVPLEARDQPSICCAEGTTCLNLESFNVPFCYDRFTTNFVLADGTSGTLSSGDLDIKGGPHVFLGNGSYSGEGGSGNIYDGNAPDTATLPIPTPYTSSGVGNAIPITQLAGLITLTTTIPGTTIQPTTIPGTTSDLTFTLDSETTVIGGTTSLAGGTTTAVSGSTTVLGPTQTTILGGATIVASGSPTTVTTEATVAPTTLPGTTVDPQTLTLTTSLASSTIASSTEANNAGLAPTQAVGIGLAGVAFAFFAAF